MFAIYGWVLERIDAMRTHSERGAAAVEYGLLVGLIAVVLIGAITLLGGELRGTFCDVVAALPFNTTTTCP